MKTHLFSGTSNKSLAELVAKHTNVSLGNVDIKRFSDGESHVILREDVSGDHVFILQSGQNPAHDHLFELLQLIDAAKEGGALKITAILPFFPYRRQERKIHDGEVISASLVARLLEAAGVTAIVLCNIHTPLVEGFFTVPVTNTLLWEEFAQKVRMKIPESEELCVVAPDAGSVSDSKMFASLIDADLITAEKYRPTRDSVELKNISGDVSGKNIIMIDDEINTAGTVCLVSDELTKLGAKKIYLAATHPVLSSNAVEKIEQSNISHIFVSDTIPTKNHALFSVVSCSKVVADSILSTINL